MWHEARKQEKKIRTMVVDYKRRAERRREFYEKFKADPAQFMQVHGRPCKIHLDSQITHAADNCMMPWQGNPENLIDRFDVRAHLDIIPEYHANEDKPHPEEENASLLNYERYRILIQNESSKTSEDKFLHQIHIEEQFGTTTGPGKHHHKEQKPAVPKAAIGYNYTDSNPTGSTWSATVKDKIVNNADPDEEESEEEVDFDLLINMDDMTFAQKAELNVSGTKYGLIGGDFMNYLNGDFEEREQIRLAKLQEEEKQAMSGRKARRERRAFKDRLILRRGYIEPPSYAAANIPKPDGEEEEEVKQSSSESSRGSSPEKIEFITSFGGDEKSEKEAKYPLTPLGASLPSKGNFPRNSRKWARSRSRSPERRKMRSRSRSRSRPYRASRSKRDRKRSTSSDSSRDRRRRRSSSSSSSSRSRSRSRDRQRKSNNKSRSSKNGKSRDSRSRSRSRDRRKRSRSVERRRRRSSSSRSSSSSSSSDSSRSPVRRKRSRRSTSSEDSRKSRSKERSTISKTEVKNGNDNHSSVAENIAPPPPKPPSPPVRRYYGRRKESSDSDSDKISLSDSDLSDKEKETKSSSSKRSEKSSNSGAKGKSVSSSSKTFSSSNSESGPKLTPQERLKRKMQAALNRQLKVDREADKQRQEKMDQDRMEREETLRFLTIKFRKRERERRHKEEIDHSRSPSKSGDEKEKEDSDGSSSSSKSRSKSPKPLSPSSSVRKKLRLDKSP